MSVTLDIVLSRQSALQNKLSILSNNIANADTVGFQADSVVFSEYLGKSDKNTTYSYLDDIATVRDTKVGGLEQTGNPLHVALQSKGYFGVQTADGIRYTRSGAFSLNTEGVLVDLQGNPVLSADGGNILIPAESETVIIAQDGSISDQAGLLAQLGVFSFANEYDMTKVGNTQLETTQGAEVLSSGIKISQGSLEKSNINAVYNMTEMMTTSRLYALNQRYIEEQLKLEAKATEQLVTDPV